jgi:hypothetical protein
MQSLVIEKDSRLFPYPMDQRAGMLLSNNKGRRHHGHRQGCRRGTKRGKRGANNIK